ncbi:DMT family transporter [Corynebacterium durum]|uniref:DMT family transporter n=1 Tax=Corynebacterium durum TaxID=61592 RepID=UPI0028E2D699|nr:DMT family transporter [Corynebacterium durum]
MQSNFIAVLFALASALTIAWGTVVRHRIAEQAPGDGSRFTNAPILTVISRPLWWAGTGTALLGYFLQTIALGFGTLLVVQPVLVLSLMFTLPLSALYDGRRISKTETFWSGALTVAVAVLVILGRPLPGITHPPLERWVPALSVGIIVMAGLERFAHIRPNHEKALILGIVTGALFGYVAVLSKAAVEIYQYYGVIGLFTNWEGYALILGATLGTAVQQSSFNAGALKNSLPAMTISEPIVAFSLGYIVLGEKFQVTDLGWLWMALALITMIISTVVLSQKSMKE